MTAMLLAIALSDAALNAHEMKNYRVLDQQEIGGSAEPVAVTHTETRAWAPGVADWSDDKADCPILFQKDIKGFGTFKVGPRCTSVPKR